MKVRSAEFLKSAMRPDQYPRDGRPEVAFAGRSNVGKSTLLNRLLGKKKLAKTSSRPGKTQTINFFDVNGAFYLVDLPGYGYAKVPLSVKKHWGKVMTAYLMERAPLRLVVHLLDARHKPTALDLEMLALLDQAQVPTIVVATKIDKVKASQYKRSLSAIHATLGLADDALILPVSGETGANMPELWGIIEEAVTDEGART